MRQTPPPRSSEVNNRLEADVRARWLSGLIISSGHYGLLHKYCVRKRGAARLERGGGNDGPLPLSTTTDERVEGGYRFTRRRAFVTMKSLWKEGERAQRERISRSAGERLFALPVLSVGFSRPAATESPGR